MKFIIGTFLLMAVVFISVTDTIRACTTDLISGRGTPDRRPLFYKTAIQDFIRIYHTLFQVNIKNSLLWIYRLVVSDFVV